MTSRRRARRRTVKSPSRAAVRTRSSSSSAGSSRGSPSCAARAAVRRAPCVQRALRQLPCCLTPNSLLVPNRAAVPVRTGRLSLRLGRRGGGAMGERERRLARQHRPAIATAAAGPDRRPLLVRWIHDAAPPPPPRHAPAPLQRQVHYAAMAYAPIAIALTMFRKRVGLPPWLAVTIASGAPLAVGRRAAAAQPRALRGGRDDVHVALQGQLGAARRRRAARTAAGCTSTIRSAFDSALCGGIPPSQRLQRALREKGDGVAARRRRHASIYGSWFLPHVLLGYALLRHPQFVPRAAGRLAASYHLTTPFYWFVPTAPPWWASEVAGRMDGDVQRVVRLGYLPCDQPLLPLLQDRLHEQEADPRTTQ